MIPVKKIKALENLATDIVGDGKSPNVFFVSTQGVIFMVTTDFEMAYAAWQEVSDPPHVETALEDRQTGVIASVGPDEENGDRLTVQDDSGRFGKSSW